MAREPAAPRSGRTLPLFSAVVRPLQWFLRIEAASGILLLAFALVALAWVNFVDAESYRAIFGAPIAVAVGPLAARFTVAELVNDGLMAVFFLLVGMEIKRELVVGELRTLGQALLPAIAAVGGMLVPGAVFLAFNHGTVAQRGWGVPMATDIAFSIGVLTVLRRRVPYALKVFLTALAIFDDLGGILVIAIFYGHGLHLGWLAAAGAVVAALVAMCRAHVRSAAPWAVAGALLWYALHHAGIHAAISGVVLGLAIPARPRRSPRQVLESLATEAAVLLRRPADEDLDAAAILQTEETLEDLEAPLTRFVHALHPWVAFGIMPLFALANSGVDLRALDASQLTGRVAVGTAVALFVGKQVGVFGATWIAVKLGVAPMPGHAPAVKLFGVAIVAGVGFTVALFVAGLAYPGRPDLLDQAKVGILSGSLVSGLVGALVLSLTGRVAPAAERPAQPPVAGTA